MVLTPIFSFSMKSRKWCKSYHFASAPNSRFLSKIVTMTTSHPLPLFFINFILTALPLHLSYVQISLLSNQYCPLPAGIVRKVGTQEDSWSLSRIPYIYICRVSCLITLRGGFKLHISLSLAIPSLALTVVANSGK